MARAFEEAFVARGMAVDMALHDEPASDGGHIVHVHYLLETREVTPDGFSGVVREWGHKASLSEWRMEWEARLELALEHADMLERAAGLEMHRDEAAAQSLAREEVLEL